MDENEIYISESLRIQDFLAILQQADRRCLEELAGKRDVRKAYLDAQVDPLP
jgi:hypothetical protein